MMMSGVDMVRVPYRGAPPAVADLVGGRIQVVFDTFAASIALVRAGKLRALAVTTATRSAALPGTPCLGDFLPGYDASNWEGIGAPKDTPPDIVEKLNKEINAALVNPALEARFADFGHTAFATSPVEFAKFIAEEKAKWGKVIRATNIKPD